LGALEERDSAMAGVFNPLDVKPVRLDDQIMSELSADAESALSNSFDGEKIDVLAFQKVTLENHRLQQLNDDMQASIDSLRVQLKQALETSASVTNMSEQITSLKRQLTEANRQIADAGLRREPNPSESSEDETAALLKQIRKLKKEVKELQAQSAAAAETSDEKDGYLKKSKAKWHRRIQVESEARRSAEERIAQLASENRAVNSDLESARAELCEVKRERSHWQAQHRESELSLQNLREETRSRAAACDNLSRELDMQSHEMVGMNKERTQLVGVIQTLYKTMCSFESQFEEVLDRAQEPPRVVVQREEMDITKLTFPFGESLKAQCRQIASMRQYEGLPCVQLILNAISKTLTQQNEVIESLQADLRAEKGARGELIRPWIAFLKELQRFAFTENQMKERAFYDSDDALCEFITGKTAEFIGNQSEAGSVGDFPALARLSCEQFKSNEHAYLAFVAQFTANALLSKQLRTASDGLLKQGEIDKLCHLLNCETLEAIPERIRSLEVQLATSEGAQKTLKGTIRSQQQTLMSNQETQVTQRLKIEKLELRSGTVQSECDLLRVKAEVTANALILAQDRTRDLEQDSRALEEQIQSLQDTVRALQSTKDVSRSLKKKNEAKRSQILDCQARIDELEEENALIKGKAKKLKRRVQQMKDCQKLVDTSESHSTKVSMQDVGNSTTCYESRSVDGEVQMELHRLQCVNKSLEGELLALRDQLRREKQLSQSTISAQEVACNSRLRDNARTLKHEYRKQKDEMISIVVRGLSGSDSIDPLGMDCEGLAEFVSQVRKDLDRLRVFQKMPLSPTRLIAEPYR
jgi:chromosome segregation ATPase